MKKKRKLFYYTGGIIFFLVLLIPILMIIYIGISYYINEHKFAIKEDWGDWFVVQIKRANWDKGCLDVSPISVHINSEKNYILLSFHLSRCKNFIKESIFINPIGYDVIDPVYITPTFSLKKEENGRYNLLINSTNLELKSRKVTPSVEQPVNVNILFKYKNEFFNYYDIISKDGLNLEMVEFTYDGGIFKGYSCSENCFILETSEGLIDESPILELNHSLKMKRYIGGKHILFRFGPKHSLYVYGEKVADGLFLGIIAGIIVKIITLFSQNKKKR